MLWTIPCVCWLSYLQVYRLWHNVNWNWCLSQLLQNFILLKPFVPPFSLSMLRWWAAGDRWWPLSLRARARVYTRSFVFFSVTSVTGLRNQDEHSLQECPTFSGKWGIYLRKCRMFSRKCGRFSRGCGSFGRIWAKSCLEELIFWEEMASVIVMWQQCDSSVTANFVRWGGVVAEKELCDSNVTAKWGICHLEVVGIVLIVRVLLCCCEGCDRCESEKQKYGYTRAYREWWLRAFSPSSPSRSSSSSRASRKLPL